MAGCKQLEPFQISRDMPQKLIVFPDGIILSYSDYDGDGFHGLRGLKGMEGIERD